MTLTSAPGAAAALDPMDFEHFVAREHRRLVRALTLYCGDQGLAEQLAQDALVRARERWPTVSAMHTPERGCTALRRATGSSC
jgi:predicted RNA polymerase sigma factor